MNLSDSERSHPLWSKIEAHLVERLADLRGQNDAHLDAEKTAHKRGQIAEVKALIQIGKEQQIIS